MDGKDSPNVQAGIITSRVDADRKMETIEQPPPFHAFHGSYFFLTYCATENVGSILETKVFLPRPRMIKAVRAGVLSTIANALLSLESMTAMAKENASSWFRTSQPIRRIGGTAVSIVHNADWYLDCNEFFDWRGGRVGMPWSV